MGLVQFLVLVLGMIVAATLVGVDLQCVLGSDLPQGRNDGRADAEPVLAAAVRGRHVQG